MLIFEYNYNCSEKKILTMVLKLYIRYVLTLNGSTHLGKEVDEYDVSTKKKF